MKCPNCGANLIIDDAVCTFCGTENPYAKQHRKEMRHFTKEFNKTKTSVLGKSRNINSFVIKIAMIAVVFALDLLLLFLIGASYDIEKYIIAKDINANYPVHANEVTRLMEQRDYIGFQTYYEYQNLYYSDLFKEYNSVEQICNSYSIIYKHTLEIYTYDEEKDHINLDEKYMYLADNLDYMYRYSKPREYSNMIEYTDDKLEFMQECVDQTEEILRVYFNLTEEETESLETLSKARRQILLEEGAKRNGE